MKRGEKYEMSKKDLAIGSVDLAVGRFIYDGLRRKLL